jgi:hypothetical protein
VSLDETTNLSTETLPPDRYLGPRRFKITCQCDLCGTIYSYEVEKIPKKDRLCPDPICADMRRTKRSAREVANIEQIVETRRPPGHIGESVVVKAIDETAKIVMQDYGLTDLKDNIRAGDSVAPKLPAPQQRMADGFFGGGAMAERAGTNTRQAEMIRRRALGGAYRGMAINPGITNFGRQAGERVLTPIRSEPLK